MTIALRSIHKHYGDIRANDGIDLVLRPSTVHGILGENGAGKSTLMKILSGYVRKTSGTILVDSEEVDFKNPAEAASHGIGMLYQDPLDFPPLTVLENFMAGQRMKAWPDRSLFRKRLAGLCREMGFDLDPETPVVRLTVGERQQLELARHLAAGRRVLILDEPTTGISSLQKDVLFSALRRLSSGGATVVLVSHKLEDVETLCDEVTVLKKGRVSGSAVRPFSTGALLEMMFGREPAPPLRKGHEPGAQALFLEGVHAHGGRTGLAQCTVKVNRGEVVGLAGLEGSGQDVFLRVAAGLTRPTRGRVHVSRKDMTGRDHHAFKTMGVAFQPAARLEEGLIAGLSVAEHCAILERSSFSLDLDASASLAQERIQSFQVAARPESPVESLSGGNQQRLLLSFLPDDPVLLLLENPTRGLDRESVRWVWERLDAIASNGAAIVFSSSEIDEILMVSDRVLVFFEGRIIHDVRPEDTDALMLGKAIAGRV